MNVSVIVSTYNQPDWLAKCLTGYLYQSHSAFEIIIADDGSTDSTRTLLQQFKRSAPFPLEHVWHEDQGFQKSKILNKATLAASGDYLVFTDGDCIPRPDFIQTHVEQAAPRTFLSGGYCKLPQKLSELITTEDIASARAFTPLWLKQRGLKNHSSLWKLSCHSPWNKFSDRLTPTRPTWNGCNSSTWKEHILEVNGHNEDMQYGGQDREMGERLVHLGLHARMIRHRAILLHLHHSRGYRTKESIRKNLSIRRETATSKSTWTPNGITASSEAHRP